MLRIERVSFVGDVYHPQNITMKWLQNMKSSTGSTFSSGSGNGNSPPSPLAMNLHYLPFHGMLDPQNDDDDDDDDGDDDKKRKKGHKKPSDRMEQKKEEEGNLTPDNVALVMDPSLSNATLELSGSAGGGDSTVSPDDKNQSSSSSSSPSRHSRRYHRHLRPDPVPTSSPPVHPSGPLPHYDFPTLKHIVAHYQHIYSGGLVIIFNIGASYTSRMKYREDIGEILEWLDRLSEVQKNVIIYRETAAQHWNHTSYGYPLNEELTEEEEEEEEGDEEEKEDGKREENGNKSKGKADSSSHPTSQDASVPSSSITSQHHPSLHSHTQPLSHCAPLADHTPLMDWKNFEIKSCLKNKEYSKIHLLPFRDVTAPLYSMHITPPGYAGGGESNHTVDCTHYCYFPQLWESIWTTFSFVITNHDRLNANNNSSSRESKDSRGNSSPPSKESEDKKISRAKGRRS